MNKSLLISVLLLAGTHGPAGTRIMAADDPNRDPKWEWFHDTKEVMYSSHDASTVTRHTSYLPYYTAGNTLSGHSVIDAFPEDGWVLVHRDFGTEKEAQPFPYFTLYNKYRGIFRVMLFNATNREGTYFIGELGFLDGEKHPEARAGLFTFADHATHKMAHENTRCYLRTYNPALKLTTLSSMSVFGSWAVFDFPLLGFDPDLAKKEPILTFKLSSVQRSDISLQSEGNIKLYQVMNTGDLVHPSQLHQAFAGFQAVAGAGVYAYNSYKSVDAFFDTEIRSEAGKKKNGGQSWFPAVAALATGPIGTYAPVISAMASVMSSFVGGGSQWQPLNFEGQFNFNTEGVLQTRKELWCHNFFLKAGPDKDARAQRPIQDIAWGIFNFTKIPASTFKLDGTVRLTEDPPLIFNPACGMTHVSTRVAFIQSGPPGPQAKPIASKFMSIDEAKRDYIYQRRPELSIKGMYIDFVRSALWELKFKTHTQTRHADNEIVIYKKTKVMSDEYRPAEEQDILLPEYK